ncbi:MAG: MiaB/RimO family radical SAM methylthiotransferase [Coriobacteriales bacterium]|nr:MiaB/RimO family radical SAM methylthiotransferase [Coriobacteriales bacterium]
MLDLSNKTYFIQVFGCQMNLSDAEHICGMLDSRGATQVGTIEKSDICIFVSCCVREAANVIFMGQVASMKNFAPASDQARITCVCGCYAQLKGKEIASELKHVNIVFGTNNIALFPQYLEQHIQSGKQVVELYDNMQADLCKCEKKQKTDYSAWLPIMTGCNNFCTYCIVPYVRGREISRPIEDVEHDLKKLCASPNLKQVTLLGQNVNSYGRDLYGSPKFAKVLELAANSGIERIRFVTSHPKDLSDETIEVFAKYSNIMPQLHLPLQSGSARILKAMNRKYDPNEYLSLVDKLKANVKDIALSTDIIVGFPGETLQDFEK